MTDVFDGIYLNKRVLVTGHTGFKGSWLCYWLQQLGATVTGAALQPPTDPNHFELLDLKIDHHLVDVRDANSLNALVRRCDPEIVFHLAAQPLVRYSYAEPVETFETNVMGTVNLYEACRRNASTKAIVTITSDKVYQNQERAEGYVETDRLGGADPYSCSKACVELITDSYRSSFFSGASGGGNEVLIATVRAGNVIGGGDWALDRIVADIARASAVGMKTKIRNPHAVRPWQHVLEPLAGYLLVGQKMMGGDQAAAAAWNFGPDPDGMVSVGDLVTEMSKHWGRVVSESAMETNPPKETAILTLQSERSKTELGWYPVWNFAETIQRVADWYRSYYEEGIVQTRSDLEAFVSAANRQGRIWARPAGMVSR